MTSLALAISTCAALSLASVPTFAKPTASPTETPHATAPTFPMPAADYRQLVNARLERARVRMEQHMTEKQVAKDRAEERRARFHALVVKVNAKVDEVCADGTVTKEEAEAVRDLTRALRHPGNHSRK